MKDVGPASVRVTARVKTYVRDGFKSIEAVEDIGHMAGSSGPYTLQDKREYFNYPLPNTQILINAIGNVVVEKSKTTTGEFSFEMLEIAGFKMTGSETDHWYAREYYNMDFLISVY